MVLLLLLLHHLLLHHELLLLHLLLIHHLHRLLLLVVLLLCKHLVLVHRVRSVHAAIEAILGVLHLDDLRLMNIGTLLLTLATSQAQHDTHDAAETGNPNHHTEETTRAFTNAGQDFGTRAGRLLRVRIGRD